MTDVLEGARIAGCRIDAVAGRGGMGIVYRATQLSLGRPVALKLIAPQHAADPGFRERFERESRLAAAIDHPNVIPVYEAGEEDGRLYLVMRWVAGTDLHRLLRDAGRLEPVRAASIVAQVAGALDAAHAAGLVHRDVKPANVLLTGEHAYLADFGLTRIVGSDSRMTTTGQWLGTVDYMAPEQFERQGLDARADVYALGCVLFAALTGGPPFARETVPATMLAHLHDEPPRPSAARGVPKAFDRVLTRALAKAPDDRYPSAGDLGRAAHAAAEGRSVTEAERSVARGAAAPLDRAAAAPDPPTLALGDERRTRRLWSRSEPAAPGSAPARAAPEPAPARAAPAPADRDPPGGQAEPRRYRARRRRVWLWLSGIAALGLAGLGIAFAPIGGDASPPPGEPVSAAQVRQLAQSFAAAYASEDSARIGRLLTGDAQRVTPGARQSGRSAVTAEYRRQFASSDTTGFDLGDLQTHGGRAGRASASYRAAYRGVRDVTGTIVWTVIRDRGRPRIALIAATPD